MPKSIPESHRDLLAGPVYVMLSTVMADGSIQSNPVWCDVEGEDIVAVNSATGRVKDRNLRDRKTATILAIDPQNPFRWIEVRGTVIEVVEGQEADNHIDDLAELYLKQRPYPFRQAGEVRVKYKIQASRVQAFES